MPETLPTQEAPVSASPGFGTLETVFEALGRILVVLDRDFRVIRASHTLDDLAYPGAAVAAMGRPIEELVGARLFGPSDTLREALEQGHREEGRRAILRCGEGSARLVSLTAAVLPTDVTSHCDPRARYIVVLRPAETDDGLVQSMISSHGLVARSPVMLRIVHLVESLQRSEATVLVTGESGTGKELIARALHANSPRCTGPFVAVNCGALPGELLESELFGHVRGAFTGAVRDRVGGSTWRTAARSSSTRWATCRSTSRSSSSASSRSGTSSGSARARPARWTRASSPPRTSTSSTPSGSVVPRRPLLPPPRRPDPRPAPPGPGRGHPAHRPASPGPHRRSRRARAQALARHPRRDGALCLARQRPRAGERPRVRRRDLHRPDDPDREPPVGAARGRRGARARRARRRPPAGDALADSLVEDPAERVRIVQLLEAAHWNRGRAAEMLGMSRSTLWRRMKELGIE